MRGIARYDSMREELLVLNACAIFCWIQFFVGIGKNVLTAHFLIATTVDNHSCVSSQPRASLLAQLSKDEGVKAGKDKDWGGEFCHSEGW